MPKVLDDCVNHLIAKGHSKSSAYAICVKSTGWKKGKDGWTKKGGTSAKRKKAVRARTKKRVSKTRVGSSKRVRRVAKRKA